MSDKETSKEERILRVMKRVLTGIAKDTYTRPGHRHPLSDDTVNDIRNCLSLITAREVELNKEAGPPSSAGRSPGSVNRSFSNSCHRRYMASVYGPRRSFAEQCATSR